MIRTNRMQVALLSAAIAAAGIGYAVQAAEDHTTTFTFNYKNCKLTIPAPNAGGGAFTITGSTNVPNVGTVTLNGHLFVGKGVTGSGTLTVKKTGDKLFYTFTSGEVDSSGEFECTVTITGGTGLYENAEGTGLVEGTIKINRTPAAPVTVGTVSFLAQGVISF